jgi:hypothetical protein
LPSVCDALPPIIDEAVCGATCVGSSATAGVVAGVEEVNPVLSSNKFIGPVPWYGLLLFYFAVFVARSLSPVSYLPYYGISVQGVPSFVRASASSSISVQANQCWAI